MLVVVGTCFALYTYKSSDITTTIMTDTAITMTIKDINGSELSLDTNELRMDNPLVKTITLGHNKSGTVNATEQGEFKVQLSGDSNLLNYINVTATDLSNNKEYQLPNLENGILFSLSNQTNIRLKVELNNVTLDQYIEIANKSVYITLSWNVSNRQTTDSNNTSDDKVNNSYSGLDTTGYYIVVSKTEEDFDLFEIDGDNGKFESINDGKYDACATLSLCEGNVKVIYYDKDANEVKELTRKNTYSDSFVTSPDGKNYITMTYYGGVTIYVNSNEYYVVDINGEE